ncbi:ANTAR domain-containing protein [Streptomyces sp. NPDC055186]
MTSAAPSPSSGRHEALVIGGRMDADRALLTPRGELVRGCADTLAEKLARLPARTARVDLDMSGVRFMDTAGLRFLDVLRDHGRRRSVPVTATRWSGQPRRLLELAGLDTTDPLRPPRRAGAPAPAPVAEAEVERLRQAIAARPVIDRARGILMASHGCSSETAWRVLREAARLSGTGLRTVATAVITTDADRTNLRPPEKVQKALSTALAHHLP